MVYFTQLLNRPVMDKEGKHIGKLTDLTFTDGEKYAEVTHLFVCENDQCKKISWEYIRELIDMTAAKKVDVDIVLTKKVDVIKWEQIEGSELLVSNLLDRQIVDITGLKVVRANDIVLRKIGTKFCIVGVDVGEGSILRRLGIDFFGKFSTSESFLPWEYVEPIEKGVPSLKVKVDRSKLNKLHPADIADIMEDLNPFQRILIFNELDEHTAAKTLVETEPEVSRAMISKVKTEKILTLMRKLDVDEIAEILGLIPKDKANLIINKLSPEVRNMLNKVRGYPEHSAGRIMNPNFISVNENATLMQVAEQLRSLPKESTKDVHYVYVVDSNQKLVGLLPLRDIIINQPEAIVSSIVNRRVIKVNTKTDKDEAAKIIIKYSLTSLPVVDEEGVLRGKIKMSDILEDTASKSYRSKPKYTSIIKQRNSERLNNGKRNSTNPNS